MIRALIVDDEPPARERLRELLGEHPDLEVAGEAGSVSAAMAEIDRERPDVVLLDIQLPAQTGFELIDLLTAPSTPAVVFVTAYADHAVRAFEVDAVDYLMKPYSRARLAGALSKVRRHLAGRSAAPALAPAAGRRIPVTVSGRTRFVPIDAIELISAERNYVRLTAGATRGIVVRGTLAEMEERLPPGEFMRVNRSAVVRLASVAEIEPLPHGELLLRLSSGAQVISGRQHSARIRSALGI